MTLLPVLILGGRSDIGLAVAAAFASHGYPIQLAVRDVSRSERDRAHLHLQFGVEVTLHEFDALAPETHDSFVESLPNLPLIAVCAVGVLNLKAESDLSAIGAVRLIRSNFEGPVAILTTLAHRFQARGFGTLIGISSVAGIRGRSENLFYGSAKAGFIAFLSGLRQRLNSSGVHVISVLPGYVSSQMTAMLSLPPLLTAQPGEVALAIVDAFRHKRDVVYVRRIWFLIGVIIQTVPEWIFKRLRF